jgi:hypothetical protein
VQADAGRAEWTLGLDVTSALESLTAMLDNEPAAIEERARYADRHQSS